MPEKQHNHEKSEQNFSDIKMSDKKLKQMATISSVLISSLIATIKIFAAFFTGSLAILSSLIDSLADILSSLISFIAVKIALKPANCDYRYGFGKAEALSALIQSSFIAGSGLFVLYDGIYRLLHPTLVKQLEFGVIIMIVSMILTCALIAFQRYVVIKTNSLAIKADSKHYEVDILTNGVIVLSLILTKYFQSYLFDIIGAIVVSFYLIYQAYLLAKEALYMLTDRELDAEIRENIGQIIMQSYGVMGYHDLRSRNAGGVYLFEVHIELDGNIKLYQAHEIVSKIEEKIIQAYPSSQIIIHEDPFGVEEKRLDNLLPGNCQKV